MSRRLVGALVVATAAGVVAAAACASFGAASNGEPPSDPTNADATTDSSSDVTEPEDAADGAHDAGPPCTEDTLVVGRKDLGATLDRSLPITSEEAYGYAVGGASASATVSCVRVFISSVPVLTTLDIGVYDDEDGGNPGQLLAHARGTPRVTGWMAATLSEPVTLAEKSRIWIGIAASTGPSVIRVTGGNTCTGEPIVHVDGPADAGRGLDDPFVSAITDNVCDAVAYLSP